MGLEILVLPIQNPIGTQECDEGGGGAGGCIGACYTRGYVCAPDWCTVLVCVTDEPKYWPAY